MGGINHQPCNAHSTHTLRHSTRMSRAVSCAHVSLETANVALEDLILDELDGQRNGSLGEIDSNLMFSSAYLRDFLQHTQDLRVELDRINYHDLPTFQAINLQRRGAEMAEAGLVDEESFGIIVDRMRRGSFRSVLDLFDEKVFELITLTESLLQKIGSNADAAEEGQLNLVLEQNRAGNFKVEFACLYTRWSNFHRLFQASSMLSTELWYAFTQCGSLLRQGEARALTA